MKDFRKFPQNLTSEFAGRLVPMTASTPRRMALDLELLKELIGALDKERGVENGRLMDAVEGGTLTLDQKVGSQPQPQPQHFEVVDTRLEQNVEP